MWQGRMLWCFRSYACHSSCSSARLKGHQLILCTQIPVVSVQFGDSRFAAVLQVFAAIAGLRIDLQQVQEEQVKPVETLISEAYQEIDKAVSKGVLKKNTGGRRKSRLALAKKKLLIDAGLYTPA